MKFYEVQNGGKKLIFLFSIISCADYLFCQVVYLLTICHAFVVFLSAEIFVFREISCSIKIKKLCSSRSIFNCVFSIFFIIWRCQQDRKKMIRKGKKSRNMKQNPEKYVCIPKTSFSFRRHLNLESFNALESCAIGSHLSQYCAQNLWSSIDDALIRTRIYWVSTSTPGSLSAFLQICYQYKKENVKRLWYRGWLSMCLKWCILISIKIRMITNLLMVHASS